MTGRSTSRTVPDEVTIDDLFAEYRATRAPDLRNRLVEIHLPIADRCARRYRNRGEPLADLIQVARMAIVRAVERFDPDRGVRFEAFAIPTVMGELQHHFRDNCWTVSVPRSAKDLRSQVFRVSEQMSQQLGRSPTVAEIAGALELSVDSVTTTLETNRHFRAMSWESLADPGRRTMATVGPQRTNDGPDDHPERIDVTRVLGALDERLRHIVVWRFYEGRTQREIGARLGIGQVQVSRLIARALRQLREQLDADGARPARDHATSTTWAHD